MTLQATGGRCDRPRRLQPLPPVEVLEARLPAAAVRPLPPGLSPLPTQGHYLDQVLPSRYGYLRWPHLPICVYVQPAEAGTTAAAERTRQWVEAVTAAIATWNRYLPLQLVTAPELADILVQRRSPPLRRAPDGRLAPARSAETVFHLFLEPIGQDQEAILPRFRIDLGSQQGPLGLQQTALHELGHALGIWGHSPDGQDVMVDRQTPQAILQPSARDLATLSQIYQQPSQIGLPLLPAGPSQPSAP